jgi:LysR family transcriptional regulator, carnitine catabolism transcriptional activator
MELAQIRYVVAVADSGSFTAAAHQCLVAQPSLSQAIKSVERELGVELFTRTTRPVRVTAAGEAFVNAARVALRAVDTIATEVASVAGLVSGYLDLVALPTLALDPVADMVGSFRKSYPGIVVRLAHPDGMDDLVQHVRSGHSELGITEATAAGTALDGLVVLPLGRQELVVVTPPSEVSTDASAIGSISAEELAELAMVAQPPGTSTRAMLDAVLASVDRRANVVVETDQRDAVVPLVLAGAGVALLPLTMARRAADQGAGLARVGSGLFRDIVIVHRDAALSPAAAAFVSGR